MKIQFVDNVCPELAPWLIGYIGGEVAGDGGQEWCVLPARHNCFVQIVLEGELTIHDAEGRTRYPAPRAGLYGILSHYRYDFDVTGPIRSFSARLQPAAAGQLFDVDPVALVDSHVALELPGGLLSALRAASDWQAMVPVMNAWLLGLARSKRSDDPVALQANRLRAMHGNIPIQQLADAAGLSLRHFQRRFRQLTGLNPKHYARICRIGHAVHRKELQPDSSWTMIALEAGYSDQPHFIRDFKALIGALPSDFLRGLSPVLRYPEWEE